MKFCSGSPATRCDNHSHLYVFHQQGAMPSALSSAYVFRLFATMVKVLWVHLNIYSIVNKQTTFPGQKNIGRVRVDLYL